MAPAADVDTDALLALARAAARQAGDLLLAGRSGLDPVRDVITKSTPTDVVTRLDLAAEEAIRRTLLTARPGDVVVGEEGGTSRGDGLVRWVVDPLDGTVNYLYGIPAWSVSIAAEVAGVTVVGVVAVPPLAVTYWAVLRGGAYRDDVPVTASAATDLSQALLATGFGYDAGLRARQGTALAGLMPHVRDVRRLGSAALDLCLLAEGGVDLYYERGLNEWDRAAGALVAREAGAVVEVDGELTFGCAPLLRAPFTELLAGVGA